MKQNYNEKYKSNQCSISKWYYIYHLDDFELELEIIKRFGESDILMLTSDSFTNLIRFINEDINIGLPERIVCKNHTLNLSKYDGYFIN